MSDDTADRRSGGSTRTVVLDLDGTLVDSVYVHVLAWRAAFADVGLDVTSASLHRAVGMGGDRLVAHVCSDDVERDHGDAVRERQAVRIDELFGRITPTAGASDLLRELRERGYDVVLASSGERDLTDRLLGLLDGADALHRTISGDDADDSKPSGDLVERALKSVDAASAVVIGDSVWDVEAAHDAGVPCLAVRTGGMPEADLRGAGAADVVADPAALVERLRTTGSLLT